MNYLGKFPGIIIYGKQRRPLIRRLLKEPSDLGLHCLQIMYEIGSSTIRVKFNISRSNNMRKSDLSTLPTV